MHWLFWSSASFVVDSFHRATICSRTGTNLSAIIIAENFEVLSRGPQDDRGMPVPAFEGHAGVARITLELLLGANVSERFRVQEFVFLDG